jgi:hypothetical protein
VCGWDTGTTATLTLQAGQSAASLRVRRAGASATDETFGLTSVSSATLPSWCTAQLAEVTAVNPVPSCE